MCDELVTLHLKSVKNCRKVTESLGYKNFVQPFYQYAILNYDSAKKTDLYELEKQQQFLPRVYL